MNILKIIRIGLIFINLKTIYFNLYYLSFREALYLPIFLSRNTKLKCMKGSIRISGARRPGMIRIGTEEIGIHDKRHNRPVWENSGTVIFDGNAVIKYGARIIVAEGATLRLGDNFRISSGSAIVCYKSIEFGHDCRISWDSQVIDTDFHRVFDEESNHINPDSEIRIGNNCWIGNHCLVQKGARLGNMVVLSSNSMVNNAITETNVVLAGSPAKIIRTSITWGE